MPASWMNGFWERTKDTGHEPYSVIAHETVHGTAVVTISPSDACFTTNGCGDWKHA
ncbi:hypothetical protein [Streptomyces sp. NPDC051132]|uniref:hypothetical protein n=1 Tax=unclassified Streptomyces TaxID=2593676 RepID=UPI00341B47A6